MPESSYVLLGRDGDVTTLTFNDPDRRNAMTQAMGEAFAGRVTSWAEEAGSRFGLAAAEAFKQLTP